MRRLLYFVIATICIISLCACSQSPDIVNSWDCTVICAEESSDNAYVISYSSEKIVSTKGVLTLENRNDFDIVVHLFADGKERVEKMAANGVTVLYQIAKDTEYTLGCHADIAEGAEIELFIYDGEGNNPF